jgi:hypothetical protein
MHCVLPAHGPIDRLKVKIQLASPSGPHINSIIHISMGMPRNHDISLPELHKLWL